MKTILLMSLFLFPSVHSKYENFFDCEEDKRNLKSKNICEKINFIDSVYSDQCFIEELIEIGSTVNHLPQLTYGFFGIYFINDSIRKNDFDIWRQKCGCKNN